MFEKSYPFEMNVLEAVAELQKGATLLDVREPEELLVSKIDGSIDIPMRQMPQQLENLPKEGCLLVLCHHGFRSAQVTSFLRGQGFANAVNVTGGIEAWALSVDAGIGRY